ncbi:B-cell scaffold protein with ankyrin repeats-like [Pelobates fuscus]|uniref:B-cell scaffold protein with ankyrin repeats-like n=1 Tax=Pelobates fuscus TaxID=191477 RepID=UPI002FE4855E
MELTGYTKDLVILYEDNGNEWAMYMKDLLTLNVQSIGLILHNLNSDSDEMLEALTFASHQCKLVVLTNVLLTSLTEKQITLLTQILQPSYHVVILLCGVPSLDGFYEMFPLTRGSNIFFTDQDPEHYLTVVSGILSDGIFVFYSYTFPLAHLSPLYITIKI